MFISGPTELDRESRALRARILELNNDPEIMDLFILEAWHWKSDSHSGIAARGRGQAVIMDQVGDYDIYVGLFWRTQASGTMEEFKDAYRRYKRNPRGLRIVLFVKDRAPRRLSQIRVQDLRRVAKIRLTLDRKGVLYRDYLDSSELLDKVESDLRHALRTIGEDWDPTQRIPTRTSTQIRHADPDRLWQSAKDHFKQADAALAVETNALNEVCELLDRVSELRSRGGAGTPLELEALRARIVAAGTRSQHAAEPFGRETIAAFEDVFMIMLIFWSRFIRIESPLLPAWEELLLGNSEVRMDALAAISRVQESDLELRDALRSLSVSYQLWQEEINAALKVVRRANRPLGGFGIPASLVMAAFSLVRRLFRRGARG